MKLLFGITSVFATSVIAKYAPGQDCRTNKGCDDNCLGSKWTVVIEAGDARMVCDPSTVDSTRYVKAWCQGADDNTQKTICDNVKGKFCNGYCFLTTLASTEHGLTTRYEQLCETLSLRNPRDRNEAHVHVNPTKELALELTGGKCDVSVFS